MCQHFLIAISYFYIPVTDNDLFLKTTRAFTYSRFVADLDFSTSPLITIINSIMHMLPKLIVDRHVINRKDSLWGCIVNNRTTARNMYLHF